MLLGNLSLQEMLCTMLQPRKQTQIKQFLSEGAAADNTLIRPLPVLHKRADYLILKVLSSLKI